MEDNRKKEREVCEKVAGIIKGALPGDELGRKAN